MTKSVISFFVKNVNLFSIMFVWLYGNYRCNKKYFNRKIKPRVRLVIFKV